MLPAQLVVDATMSWYLDHYWSKQVSPEEARHDLVHVTRHTVTVKVFHQAQLELPEEKPGDRVLLVKEEWPRQHTCDGAYQFCWVVTIESAYHNQVDDVIRYYLKDYRKHRVVVSSTNESCRVQYYHENKAKFPIRGLLMFGSQVCHVGGRTHQLKLYDLWMGKLQGNRSRELTCGIMTTKALKSFVDSSRPVFLEDFVQAAASANKESSVCDMRLATSRYALEWLKVVEKCRRNENGGVFSWGLFLALLALAPVLLGAFN